jgi:8-amino-7-oxononanoate synthase
MKDPEYLLNKLSQRKSSQALRTLSVDAGLIDFYSNDYLCLARNHSLTKFTENYFSECMPSNGSTGSRLISGNHPIHIKTEIRISAYHDSEAALLFNSGYDANLGFFSSVPSRHDTVLFDEFIHASIRDGMRLSYAQTLSFKHNDTSDLESKLAKLTGNVWVVTEAVFSMDGTVANIQDISAICRKYKAWLVVDEAHGFGCYEKNEYSVTKHKNSIYARIVTYGKAAGCHGAAVVGSKILIDYLVNYARSFIYTTALTPHSAAAILAAYDILESADNERLKLRNNFQLINKNLNLKLPDFSPVISILIGGNYETKCAADYLQSEGFMVKAILSPTVPSGSERLRISLHSFNSTDDILRLCNSMIQLGLRV